MRRTALLKDILREIKKTLTRFLSITVMIMIGVFVLVGLKVTGPMMRDTATFHTNAQNMYDIKVSTPVGINSDDINEMKKISDISIMEAGKAVDLNWKEKKINISVESYKNTISTPEIIEGRAPEREGEILIEYINLLDDVKIGDIIEFQKETDKFKTTEDDYLKTYKYEVVGKAISTDYIMQGIKGMSLQSGASIDTIAYIIEDNFKRDDYSFVKMRFGQLIDKDPESSYYRDYINKKKTDIKDILEPRAKIKFEDIKTKNYKKINEAKKDIKEAKKQIQNAEEEFKNAKIKLDDARLTLDEAKIKIKDGQDELKLNEEDARNKIYDARIKIQDGKLKLFDAKKEIEKNEKEYIDGLEKYNDGLEKFKEAEAEILNNENKLKSGIEQVEGALSMASSGLEDAKSGLVEIQSGISRIDEAIITLKSSPIASTPQIQAKISSLVAQKSSLQSKETEIKNGISNANSAIANLNSEKSDLDLKKNLLEQAKEKLEENRKELDDARLELEDARKKLDEAKIKLEKEENNLKKAEVELVDAENDLQIELKKGRTKIADAIIDYEEGESKYIKEKAKYDEKLADFNEKKIEANVDIKDGEKKIEDAKDILQNLSEPRFIVENRKDNDALYFLYESSQNLDIVSLIFPVFFFFIAILVSIATMTRMVEENRIEIGTYKSLGYGGFDIYCKYILYGLISSLMGGILGGILGSIILPKAIYKAYSASYVIKELNATPDLFINIFAIIFGVLSNILTIVLVVRSTLNENAASLLRPKSPKKAKKILLEKIPMLWNKLKFLNKVTLRNLFRYKARMFMTIFGIAGCTGLVFLGFSLREALGGIKDKQFKEIYQYDLTITTDKSLPKDGIEDLNKFLKSKDVERYAKIYAGELVLENIEGRDQSVTLMVPENQNDFKDLVKLKKERSFNRIKEINLDNPTVSHKLLYYSEDGNLTLYDSNLNYYDININQNSIDFYVGHVLFMNIQDFETIFNKKFETNSYLVRLNNKNNIDTIIEALRKNTSILTVSSFDDNLKIIEDWIESIGIITIVILICSAALAFVVLYNLTNINISERKRELSTIKVLGFTTEELTSYIYRETVILSLIGIIFGFGIGWALIGTVSEVLTPDNVQMNLLLSYKPYLLSAIITEIFVFTIRLIVIKRLKYIDMVESLKSYE